VEPLHGDDKPHLPPPSLWPVGFAIGVACILVGLIVRPTLIVPIGAAIALVFAFLWARDAMRGQRTAVPDVEPERRPSRRRRAPAIPADQGEAAMPEPEPGERFPRSRFLEGATLGLGGLIGGLVTVPVLGPAIADGFLHQHRGDLDLGPLSNFPVGKYVITTFFTDPDEGDVTRRTAYVRNNGEAAGGPSFTIISNRCAHLGCPVQPNGPVFDSQKRTVTTKSAGEVTLIPTLPAGFGCPCHGGQYNKEGERTAGPPVRGLDRYDYLIRDGHLVLLKAYSVGKVHGKGANAKIERYPLTNPGDHVKGIESWLYPIQPPH
jgi:quinol---cytochrome c reductase iron-sulfur subunit, bacillus type